MLTLLVSQYAVLNGRYAPGKNLPAVNTNSGFSLDRADGNVRLQGDPCTPAPVPRYKGPSLENMNTAQRKIYDDIARTRSTGAARGPFGVWISSPDLADASQNLGRICRYETSFSQREAEIAILATGYAYQSSAEWSIHVDEARDAGLEDEHIAALACGAVPSFEPNSREAAIHAVVSDLLEHKRVTALHYNIGVAALGEKGLVELVAIVGYYSYVSLTLNAFEIVDPLLPPGVDPMAPWDADARLPRVTG